MAQPITLLDKPYSNADFSHHFSQFSYPLRDFQKHAIEGIATDKNVLVIASTGNGKTVCCEFAFKFWLQQNKKVIYTSPIKALSNQKFHDFSKLFPPSSVGISTGDITFNCESASIIIMTTEILRMMLFQNSNNVFFDFADIGCIIFDEAHYINNLQRGKVWEETIILSPPHIQLLFLSATLNHPERFANWIQTVKPERNVVIPFTTNRVVPLNHYVFTVLPPHYIKNIKDKEQQQEFERITGKPLILKDNTNKFHTTSYNATNTIKSYIDKKTITIKPTYVLNSVAKYIKEFDMLPAICFIYSRKNIEKWVSDMELNLYEDDSKIQYTIKEECKQILMKFPNYREYIALPEFEKITNLLQKGIAYHHAGMISVYREMVEILFDKGYIKLLYATETFSIGLNLKIKTVLFSDIHKFDGTIKRILHAHEYAQTSGRAGRQGYDSIGYSIHLNNMFDLPNPTDYNTMLNGNPQTIESKFKITFNLVLNMFVSDTSKTVIEKTMVNETVNARVADLLKENEKIKKELDLIILPATIDENKINEVSVLKKQFLSANGNQRRKIAKQLEPLEKEVTQQIISAFNRRQELLETVKKNEEEAVSSKNFLRDTVEKIKTILTTNGFIADGSLTEKSKIAINLLEVHPLGFTDLLEATNYFETFTPIEIIGIFSCFSNPSINDNDLILPEMLDEENKVMKVAKTLHGIYNKYIDEEARFQINTDSDYELQFNLIEPTMKWATACSEEECKIIIGELGEIFLGEFVRALLKINNIAVEMERTVGNNVEFKHKMSLIPPMVLKFIATNQSLYV